MPSLVGSEMCIRDRILMEEKVIIKEISTILNMVDARIGQDIGKKGLTEFYGERNKQEEGE